MINNNNKQKVEANEGKFEFDGVLVGDYTIEILNNKFCWKVLKKELKVGNENISDI